jgi:hypothetical protein
MAKTTIPHAATSRQDSAGQKGIMKTTQARDEAAAAAGNLASITGSHRRTLDAIFRHPSPHNLEWKDVVALIEKIGESREEADNKFVFEVAGKRHHIRKPHTKDLTSDAVIEIRHFLMDAEFSPVPSEAAAHPHPSAPDLAIVVDHHGTKIFRIDISSDDASAHVIRPYDPDHFLHHLTHKDQDRERGQRAPEEPAYYEKIADAVALGGRIFVIGHGAGNSSAAHHLTEYLRSHHRETYQRIVREIDADLSSTTTPQLLVLARQALSQ